jgi:sigma-B regulation protein RsbU (phosphoserine phosphatase)
VNELRDIVKKKILVVDDDESIRKLLSRILLRAGYEVEAASGGKEALEFLAKKNFNLIILDMDMPQMTGIDFLINIKEEKITNIPVLMLSGTTNVDQIIKIYELGAYDFIRKPEHPEIILKRVENGLKIGDMLYFNDFIKLELLVAKKLQKYLFPEANIETENVDIQFWMMPLSEIGGDLYDTIVFRDGRIIFFMADVSGHSISGAMYTTIVNMIFRNALKETQVPGEILSFMNRELSENLPIETFVTMFCGLLDFSKNIVSYANAGHPKPFLFKKGSYEELLGNDSFLGPINDAEFRTFTRDIETGDVIAVFTDGILELKTEDILAGRNLIIDTFSRTEISIKDRLELLKTSLVKQKHNIMDDCSIIVAGIK